MIRTLLACLVLSLSAAGAQAQATDSLVGLLDADALQDTLLFHFEQDPQEGPVYRCVMRRGNGRTATFDLAAGVESLRMTSCRKGCIETYEWKGGNEGFETTTVYQYSAPHDNWLLRTQTTVPAGGGRKIFRPKKPTGIDGKEYSPARRKSR